MTTSVALATMSDLVETMSDVVLKYCLISHSTYHLMSLRG